MEEAATPGKSQKEKQQILCVHLCQCCARGGWALFPPPALFLHPTPCLASSIKARNHCSHVRPCSAKFGTRTLSNSAFLLATTLPNKSHSSQSRRYLCVASSCPTTLKASTVLGISHQSSARELYFWLRRIRPIRLYTFLKCYLFPLQEFQRIPGFYQEFSSFLILKHHLFLSHELFYWRLDCLLSASTQF